VVPLFVVGINYELNKAGVRTNSDLAKWLILLAYFLLFTGLIWWIGDTVHRIEAVRRRTEREARDQAAEVRDLYDEAPCGYHSVRPDGVFLAVNKTELTWLGYEAA